MDKAQTATGVTYSDLTEDEWQRGVNFLRNNRHDIGFAWDEADHTYLVVEEATAQHFRDFEAALRG
jgi:hypothetical protein